MACLSKLRRTLEPSVQRGWRHRADGWFACKKRRSSSRKQRIVYAAVLDYPTRLKALLKSGIVNDRGEALVRATLHGNNRCVRILIAHDANVEEALIGSASEGFCKSVDILIEEGVDVNVQDKNGNTALIEAAREGHDKCLERLIQRGAKVNAQNKNDSTALMLAVMGADGEGQLECAKALIAAGAEMNIKDDYGRTALMLAAGEGHLKCLQILIASGAKLNIKDKFGRTALTYAKIEGHDHCVEALIRASALTRWYPEGGTDLVSTYEFPALAQTC